MSTPNHVYGDSFIPGWPKALAVPYGGPYRAKVVEVHDADTLLLEISVGFNIRTEQWVRLYGVNSPELSTVEGRTARDFVKNLLPVDTPVRLTTLLSTKGEQVQTFVRFVGDIEYVEGGYAFDLAAELVTQGYAGWCDRDLRPLANPPPPISRWMEPAPKFGAAPGEAEPEPDTEGFGPDDDDAPKGDQR